MRPSPDLMRQAYTDAAAEKKLDDVHQPDNIKIE